MAAAIHRQVQHDAVAVSAHHAFHEFERLAVGQEGKGNTIFTSSDDPNINAVRPYLGHNAINAIESAFDSNYNGLLVSFQKRFHTAGLIGLAYTYSKNLTDNASDRSNAPQNSYSWHEGEYGPATLDRQQVLELN
jgi:hypothetical protein